MKRQVLIFSGVIVFLLFLNNCEATVFNTDTGEIQYDSSKIRIFPGGEYDSSLVIRNTSNITMKYYLLQEEVDCPNTISLSFSINQFTLEPNESQKITVTISGSYVESIFACEVATVGIYWGRNLTVIEDKYWPEHDSIDGDKSFSYNVRYYFPPLGVCLFSFIAIFLVVIVVGIIIVKKILTRRQKKNGSVDENQTAPSR